MNKKIIALIFSMSLFLSGCNEVSYATLSYQAGECFADNSVSCNDVRVQKAVVATELFRKQLIEEKQRAVNEIGEKGYQKLLLLVDQKIEHLEKQRPNFYLRWFEGDSTYYKEVDFGEHIDAEIDKLINGHHKKPELVQQPVVETSLAASEPVEQSQAQLATARDAVTKRAAFLFQKELGNFTRDDTYVYDSIKIQGEPRYEKSTLLFPVTLRFKINSTDVYYTCEEAEISYDLESEESQGYIPDSCVTPH